LEVISKIFSLLLIAFSNYEPCRYPLAKPRKGSGACRAFFYAQEEKMFCPMKVDNAPVFITPPFEPEINLKDFGLGVDCIIKITPKGAKNTEQQVQVDSDKPNSLT
jgi:hypothetical protein